jgi:cytoskeletal protein CcmA (bactofilin family)
MAIFNKNNGELSTSSETSIIASDAKIEGVFNCGSRLHVDGVISGQVNSQSIVTIGKNGSIHGEVYANKLIINGLFEGDANCDTVEVLAGGKLLGRITSKELILEAKAHFEGESKIKKENDTVMLEEKQKDK